MKKNRMRKNNSTLLSIKKSLVVNSNNQNQKKKQQISIWIKTTTTTNKIGSRLFSVSLSLSIWELGDCMIDSILFFDIFSLFLFCLCKKKIFIQILDSPYDVCRLFIQNKNGLYWQKIDRERERITMCFMVGSIDKENRQTIANQSVSNHWINL